MPTIEERLQALEQEHAQLKKTIELQTIAIGALVNKATLERLNERYDKLFDTLITHDQFTNHQLAELREQHSDLDGKVIGLQTEMRQRFEQQDGKIAGLQTEMRQGFQAVNARFEQQDSKIAGLQTETRQRFAEHTTLLTEHTALLKQILARLPERPEYE